MVNMAFRPWCAAPTSSPIAPSKCITHVELPWIPILCSRPVALSLLASPKLPSALTKNLGTANSEIPLTPSGASGKRANTKWMMLSARSWSPDEIKIFSPLMANTSSPAGTALVRNKAKSVPAWDSVKFMVPVHSPLTSFAKYFCFSASLPWTWMAE